MGIRSKGARPAAAAATFCLALLLVAPTLLSVPTAALTITTFSDGSALRTITFVAPNGIDNGTSLSILKESRVVSAYASVSAAQTAAGRGPSDVAVYVGTPSQANQVWGFSGTGYGGLGSQMLFADGTDHLLFDSNGSAPASLTTEVLLPYEANVSFSVLRVDYGFRDEGFLPPVAIVDSTAPWGGQLRINGSAVPYLVDIDADGDLDLYVGGGRTDYNNSQGSGPKFYRNTGNASSFRFVLDSSGVQNITPAWYLRPALADLDGDGDFDLTVMGGRRGAVSSPGYWINGGTIYSPSWTSNATGYHNWSSDPMPVPTFADLDDDGDMDLVIGDSRGRLTMYENVGSATNPAWRFNNLFRAINASAYAAPNFADFDGDGDLDLVIGNETDLVGTNWGFNTSMIRMWENTGTKTNPSFQASDAFDDVPLPNNGNSSRPSPFLADMDLDGDLDMIVGDWQGRFWYYEGRASWPTNITIDVGADGTPEAILAGGGPGYTNITSGLSQAFNDYLNGLVFVIPPAEDAWGNAMIPVPINISTETDGLVRLSRIFLLYAYTARTIDFADQLDAARAAGNPSSDGTVSIPLPVTAATRGTLILHAPRVELDLPPEFESPPGQIALDEDTRSVYLFNLSAAFIDDYTWGPYLNYTIVANSAAGIIGVTTNGGHLNVDAATGSANDNWNGYVRVTVRATDQRGLSTEGVLTVWVRPVNDPPTLGPLVGTHVLYEDEPWQIFPQAEDVDGDPLTWTLSSFPGGPQINATSGAIHWTPTAAHVGDHSVGITVSDGVLSATVDILLTVLPTNDPPTLLPFPTVTVDEGVPFSFDLAPYIVDDDGLEGLVVTATSPHTSLSGTVVSGLFPVGSGVQVEKVEVTVTDPDGASATGSLPILVVPRTGRLALVGVPDLQVVETVPKTLDVEPFVKNAQAMANITLTTDSPYATVAGLKVTFLIPVGTPLDLFPVLLTVTEGQATASWTIQVTVVRLGSTLLIADLPDVDVVEGLEVLIDLRPYLHHVQDLGALTLETDSPRAWVTGTTLHLLYPSTYLPPSEEVTVTAREGAASSSDALSVFVHRQGSVLTVDPLPAVTVLEGEPYTFSLTPFVHGANPLSEVTLSADSSYATTEGLVVTLLYPVGSGVSADPILLTTRWRGQSFTSVLKVTVVPWQDAFLFGGVPNFIVVAGVPLTVSLPPYFHNLGDRPASAVQVTASSPRVTVGPGPSLTILYDTSWQGRSEIVELTAMLDGVTRRQDIEVRVRTPGTGLDLAPLPKQYAREDEPLEFEVATYILNAQAGGLTVLADSAFATVSGTVVTFLFPDGVEEAHVWITVLDGGDAAQGLLIVHVTPVNDAPTVTGALGDRTVRVGDTVVFDLSQLFDDEESRASLILRASDSRVEIDAVARTATFFVPAAEVFEITFTAVDPLDENLTVSAPPVYVTGWSPATPNTVGAGSDLLLLVLVVVGVAALAGYARWRQRRRPQA